MAKKTKPEIADNDFIVGTGNYLKDRGYADPAEIRAKFFMANQIAVAIEERGLSQTTAGSMAGLKQPDVSRIVNGNVKEYSVWRLMTTLKALGYDIKIEIERGESEGGRISVRKPADEEWSITLT